MQIKKVYIGGWFQRTTLHLTEVWNFLKYLKSEVGIPQNKLKELRNNLGITHVSRESAGLEYLFVKTKKHINYRIYEDGLIVLEKDVGNLKADFKVIKDYYDNDLSKALSLIFSKGAPVPKELADIQTILPYIVLVEDSTKEEIEKLYKDSKEEIYSTINTQKIQVFRGRGLIVINNLKDQLLAQEIIESQIFFREFKTQLHRYLSIHRIIWDKIAAIKEKGEIKGYEIDALRGELSDYQKTISLIGARIKQMGVYIRTRQKITDLQKVDTYLNPLFQFKFETLQDTHEYIKYLWDMTEDYLDSAIELFTELQAKSTKNSISSLQLVTTIGVVAGILGYLGRNELPKLTSSGLIYFGLLMILTWVLNRIIFKFYNNKGYAFKSSSYKKIK